MLFADLSGSTALGEQLDPERLRALLSEYFAAMASVIELWGGTVEKFIGDAVMSVFGIPSMHEDDAERALRAALEMQARLGEMNPELRERHGVQLELIGVFYRDLAARSWLGAPSLRAIDSGGGLATWAVATDAIDEDVARLNARGAKLEAPIDGQRRRPDGAVVRWRLAAPRELGPATPPFLIEHDVTAAEWTAAERVARAAQTHPLGAPVRLETLELEVPDIARASGALLRTIGIGPFRPSLSGRRARDAPIGRQTVRLRAAMGLVAVATWPVATIHLRAVPVDFAATPVEPRTVELLGCRFVVTP